LKAVIKGGVSWIKASEQDAEKIRTDLTYQRFDYIEKRNVPFHCWSETKKEDSYLFVVPRCYPINIIQQDYTQKFTKLDISMVPGKSLNWKGVDQENWIENMRQKALQNGIGGYGLAPCGVGKTLMGLELIRRMGMSALVIVSRQFQIDQWKKEGNESFTENGSPLQLGVIKSGVKDIEHSIVLCVINSLMDNNDTDFYNRFGVVLFDECHHLPAGMYLSALGRLRSQYMFGLTASFHRSDNLQNMFSLLIGETLAEAKAPTCAEKTKVIQLSLSNFFAHKSCQGKTELRVIVAKKLAANHKRNQIITTIITQLWEMGRNILVFHALKLPLERLISSLPQNILEESGKFTGDETAKQLNDAVNKKITFTTYSMGNEGLNAPWKDTIICATPPPSNIKQLKGRIEREYPDKKTPIIIDIIDDYWIPLKNKGISRKWKWLAENASFSEIQIPHLDVKFDFNRGNICPN
jgi:superfamily II DNA or RNA helicase